MSNAYDHPTEIINGARTSENMQAANLCGPGQFSNIVDSGGCWALNFEPCTLTLPGGVITQASWQPAVFSEEEAPWYNGTDVSRDAIGFLIEEWTGLDGSHHTRSVTSVGTNRGGALFGPQSHKHRVMKLNVLLHGRNQEACNYLFRWLEQTLLAATDPCETISLWLREFDPGIDPLDVERGVARLDNVVLIEGPTWEADPAPGGTCYVRRCSFTLAAGDPCMYRAPVILDNEAMGPGALSSNRQTTGPDYWLGNGKYVQYIVNPALPDGLTNSEYGRLCPLVTLYSPAENGANGRKSLPDISIKGYASYAGFADSPRMEQIGELVITGRGTSGMWIEIDMAKRRVRYRDFAQNSSWRNGSHLVGPAVNGMRRWWSLDPCVYGRMMVTPTWTGYLNQRLGSPDPPSSFTFFLDAVVRFGCA